jgi:hypothetical protein
MRAREDDDEEEEDDDRDGRLDDDAVARAMTAMTTSASA